MDRKYKIASLMRTSFALTLAAVLLLTSFGYSDESNAKSGKLDWHQWRGPNRDGISNEKGISGNWQENGPVVLWQISVGDGYSGISVADGKLFTMWDEGDSQFLFCLDALTGKELWRYKVDDSFTEGYGNGPRSTPVLEKTIVYAASARGLLHAVNISNGQALWTHDLGAEYGSQLPAHGYSSSPLVDGEKLFVEVGGKEDFAFAALNKHTGDLIWHSQTDMPAYSSPIAITIDETRQIVFLSATGLSSVSPDDGSLYWHYDWEPRCPSTGIPTNTVTPIFIAPDKIFISSGFGTVTGAAVVRLLHVKEQFSAEKLWEISKMKNLINSSVCFEDHIYGFDMGVLKCFDALTGEEKWKAHGFKRGALIAADGHLIIFSEHGKLALVKATPEEYREVASVKVLSGKCWTIPTLADGKLYLRNQKEMVCLDILDNSL
jgi:outer membrane protein assembly factor BamB